MVEINNQRKAFLDMLAWSEGTDNGRSENRNHGLWRHCKMSYLLIAHHPRKLVTLNWLKSGARTLPGFFPVGGMPTASNSLKRLLSKVWTLWHCSGLRSVALYLWLIVVISVRQSRPLQQYLGFLPGAGYGQFEHKADSLIAKFKEAGGTVREIDVWASHRRLSPLWLSASSSACHGLLIITVLTLLPYKPSATKSIEGQTGRTRQLLTCRCVSVMLLRSMQNTRRVSWYRLKMMLCVMMLPLVVVGCTSKRSSIGALTTTTPPAWMAHSLPQPGRHRWTGLFHPQRLNYMQKQLEGTQKYINEQCR